MFFNKDPKKFLIKLVFFMLVAVAIGFAGGQEEKKEVSKARITVWGCFSELQKPLDKAVEVFMRENPGAQVEALVFDLRDFEAKVAATAPVGQAADLIVIDHTLTRRYAKANILAQASAEVEKLVKTTGRYISIAPEICSYEGKVVGLPFFGGGPALFYNKDHLEEAGLSAPPKTLDEVYNYAVKLRKKDAAGNLKRAGYSIRLTGPTGGTNKFGFISNQMLGKDIVEPGKVPDTFYAVMDNEPSARALMWHVNLLQGPDKSDDWALKHDAEGFAAGEVSMFMRESWVIPFMKENAPDISYGVQFQPRDKYWRVYDWLVNACVPESGKRKDIAWEFAKVMQRKEIMEVLFKDSGWIPSRRDISFDEILAEEPRFKPFIETLASVEIYFEANCSSYTELWTRVGEIIQAAYRNASLLNNLQGCREVMKEAHDLANEILKDSKEYGE